MFSVFDSYTLRYIDWMLELGDAIRLFDSGLNDIAMQLLKINLFRSEQPHRDHAPEIIDFQGFHADILAFLVDSDNGSGQISSIGYAAYRETYEILVQLNLLDREHYKGPVYLRKR
ncbi:MAG: hypothetical protein ABRQ24_03810 [Syntrophomonadaceae bacterium]